MYLFFPAGRADLSMDVSAYGTPGNEINTVLDYANNDVTRCFVVQVDEQLTDAVTYGIRSTNSAYWLGSAASGDRVVQTGNKNYRNASCRWQFIPNDDGTVLIKHYETEKYFCWTDYGTANTLKDAPSDNVFTNGYKWNMTQTHMQDAYFTTGLYWIETRLPDSAGVVPMDTTLGTPKYVVSINKSQAGGTEPEYTNANYNFVLQSNAYFVYHAEKQLFFDFEGDDDVYLFINGHRHAGRGGHEEPACLCQSG